MRLALWLLEMAAMAIAVVTVWRLDMLPGQYLLILAAGCMLVWSLTGLMLFLPGGKRRKGGLRRGLGCVIVLLVVSVCAALSTVASDVYRTMHAIAEQPEENGVIRTVYVRADDPARGLEDAGDYIFAAVEGYDTVNTGFVIDHVRAALGTEIKVETFESVPAMVDALYGGTVDAIILNSAYAPILEEDGAYADFSQRVRVLYQVEIRELPVETQPNADATRPTQGQENSTLPSAPEITLPAIEDPQDIAHTPFVVYVSGNDLEGSQVRDGRSDVNILVVVNPKTKQILLINTPRDYYIPNPAGGGVLDKLTHCGNDGVANSMNALSDLYGVPVSYYASINFSGFETLIDAIGGITVYSEYSYTAVDTWIRTGENHLNGKQALDFARERKNLPGGDNARGQNQMKVIRAVIEKLTSGTTLITGYAEILDSLGGMFRMNLSVQEISQLVKMQLTDMASWTVYSYAVKGSDAGGMEYTYSVPGTKLWVMYPYYDTVQHASMLIEKIVSGETLTEADLVGPRG